VQAVVWFPVPPDVAIVEFDFVEVSDYENLLIVFVITFLSVLILELGL
jgi:hypothetical protein